ncbi:MAG: hypothetical protein ACYCRD_07365 [Leptospirillum sp.]
METLQMSQNRAYVLGKILGKSFQAGRTALADPVPELWNEDSVDSRIETMKGYFEDLLNKLGKEYESLLKEPVTPGVEIKILNAIEEGFETLMGTQPGYHESFVVENEVESRNMKVSGEHKAGVALATKKIEAAADKKNARGSSESNAEIAEEMKKAMTILLEKRHEHWSPTHKGIWIEENDAIIFVRGVFDTMREDHDK